MGKKKRALRAKAHATISKRAAGRSSNKEERRAQKLERRKKEKKAYTADQWAEPAPAHLVATLDLPKVKSKYQSYYEFARNPDKKDKPLDIQEKTDTEEIPAGCAFVPVGDPMMTSTCKELSRDQGAMIFIVSKKLNTEQSSKIANHVHRIGFYFRESIIKEAREITGETVMTTSTHAPGEIEPIPKTQEEINKQAEGAIKDLFPRIPNTDKDEILERAFTIGRTFHGEPTVGLQPNIPLSRRVQLAVLAHVRHNHTNYDNLLRETSWMNARKVVEQTCLDVLVKWRGDEETGRDQMDEILREVVVITDSEDEDDSSDDDETSSEEGEITSDSSPEAESLPVSRNQERPSEPNSLVRPQNGVDPRVRKRVSPSRTHAKRRIQNYREKRQQRGFNRYRAAWDEALHRKGQAEPSTLNYNDEPSGTDMTKIPSARPYSTIDLSRSSVPRSKYAHHHQEQLQYAAEPSIPARPDRIYTHPQSSGHIVRRDEVNVRPYAERPVLYQDIPHRVGTPSRPLWDQGPPQVVRASPSSHNLQDMLVPSIEKGAGDISSPHPDGRDGVFSNFSHPQDSYSRRAMDHRILSPSAPQVIVINDGATSVKRRRLIREDEIGHLRPLPTRNHSVSVPVTRSDSHFISTSVAHDGDFSFQRPRSSVRPTQGLYRDTQSVYTDPVTAEQLPIYDEPESGQFSSHPAYHRRPDGMRVVEEEDRSVRHVNRPQIQQNHQSDGRYHNPSHLPSWDDNMGIVERERGVLSEPVYGHENNDPRRWPQQFPVPDHSISAPSSAVYGYGPVQSNAFAPSSQVQAHAPVHNFSQSQHDGYQMYARDGYSQHPQSGYQNVGVQGSVPYYEQHPGASYAPAAPPQARSSVQYMQQPANNYYNTEPQQAPVQYHEQKPMPVQYQVPSGGAGQFTYQQYQPPAGAPTWSQPIDPRRQVVVLE